MRFQLKKSDGQISRIESFLLWYFAIMICVYNNCFIKWDTYNHAAISAVFKLMYHTVSSLMLIYAILIRHQKKRITIVGVLSILLAFILYIHANFMGSTYKMLNAIPMLETIIVVIALYIMDNSKKQILLNRVIIVFSILVLPSMIYFVFYTIGIRIPYSVLASDNPGKALRQVTYMHYPMGLIIKAPWSIARYTGVFDEAGYVGTFAALLIAVGYRRCDRKWSFLLFLEGLLSLSMAFYVLFIIFIIVRAFADRAIKAVGIISLIAIGFVIFINIPFQNDYLKDVQNRVDISSSFFIEDNRTSDSFDTEFEAFIQKGGYELAMGKGGMGAYEKNPKMVGSNSYKCLIYDIGILGFLINLAFFFTLSLERKWNKEYLPFLVVFIASIYQRAYVYNVQMVSLFIIGLVYIYMVEPQELSLSHKRYIYTSRVDVSNARRNRL